MKKNLISGLILLLPVAITAMILIFLVDLFTTPFLIYMENVLTFFGNIFNIDLTQHHTTLLILSRICILIFLFFFLILLGFLGNWIFFHFLVKKMHQFMLKIPLINTVYRVCKDIVNAILSDKKKIFSRVVVVPFPCSESRALGLITGKAPHGVQDPSQSPEILKSVFIPTSPHPISGFLLLTEEKYLNTIDISVEDAFKYLISCGIFTPERNEKAKKSPHEESNPFPSQK